MLLEAYECLVSPELAMTSNSSAVYSRKNNGEHRALQYTKDQLNNG